MANRELPSPELLRKLLDYDPETGALTWRERDASLFKDGQHGADKIAAMWNTKFAGKLAGTLNSEGYVTFRIFGVALKSHRVIWAMVHGRWPAQEIDHVDHDRANNRLSNLREVSLQENHKNRKMPSTNKSGVTGVCWATRRQRWVSTIRVAGRIKQLGVFSDFDKAVAARKAAEMRYGYHTNHGVAANSSRGEV